MSKIIVKSFKQLNIKWNGQSTCKSMVTGYRNYNFTLGLHLLKYFMIRSYTLYNKLRLLCIARKRIIEIIRFVLHSVICTSTYQKCIMKDNYDQKEKKGRISLLALPINHLQFVKKKLSNFIDA